MDSFVGLWEDEYQILRSFVKRLERPEGPKTKMLAAAVERELTQRQRQMVYLYYVEQYNMKDIAKILGLNPSTVSRTLKVAREKLKVCLSYTGLQFLRDD